MVPALEPIVVGTEAIPPDVSELTTQSISGTGIFDVLMHTTNLHLIEEFNSNRITGEQYSVMYTALLTAVLSQSISFLSSHQQGRLVASQIALVRQQTVTELTKTDNDIPLGLGMNGSVVVEGLVAAELLNTEKQGLLLDQQVDTAKATKDLTGQKIITEVAQTDNGITQARLAGYGFNDGDTISGALEGANLTSIMTAKLAEQKVATEVAQTSTTKPLDLGEVASLTIGGLAGSQNNLLVAQAEKMAKEVTLIAQKAVTELAQTSEAIPTGTGALNTNTTVAGSVLTQKTMYAAQTKGYAQHAEQAAAGLLLKSWNVMATMGDVGGDDTNKLSSLYIGRVMDKLRAGIDVA